METIYLVCLLVGGFFVALSAFGGDDASDHDSDFDAGHDFDHDADVDHDIGHDVGHGLGAGPGLVDPFTLRALFLFMAFFGLTGSLFSWFTGLDSATTLISASAMGLVAGLGGNYVIKKMAYETVTSSVSTQDLRGRTAKVLVPFERGRKGKILLVSKGSSIQMLAAPFDEETAEAFERGEEVVVIGMSGSVAQVVKPT